MGVRGACVGSTGGRCRQLGAGARRRAEQAVAGGRGVRHAGPGRGGHARPRRRARAAWALGARAGQGCALSALRLVFNLVFRLGIFPESLNEHYSL